MTRDELIEGLQTIPDQYAHCNLFVMVGAVSQPGTCLVMPMDDEEGKPLMVVVLDKVFNDGPSKQSVAELTLTMMTDEMLIRIPRMLGKFIQQKGGRFETAEGGIITVDGGTMKMEIDEDRSSALDDVGLNKDLTNRTTAQGDAHNTL